MSDINNILNEARKIKMTALEQLAQKVSYVHGETGSSRECILGSSIEGSVLLEYEAEIQRLQALVEEKDKTIEAQQFALDVAQGVTRQYESELKRFEGGVPVKQDIYDYISDILIRMIEMKRLAIKLRLTENLIPNETYQYEIAQLDKDANKALEFLSASDKATKENET